VRLLAGGDGLGEVLVVGGERAVERGARALQLPLLAHQRAGLIELELACALGASVELLPARNGHGAA
jgi:hypothetical protein